MGVLDSLKKVADDASKLTKKGKPEYKFLISQF